MIHNPSSVSCAGSLTPQLEGAARSVPHPVRTQQTVKPSTQAKKGGAQHE